MGAKYHINPRFRAYGKARLDVTLRAKDEREWQALWREPRNEFPFNFGAGWKSCFEYRVDDYAAEVGFFIDVLGFQVIAFSPNYAKFASPDGELCFSVVEAVDEQDCTPPDSIRIQLQVYDVEKTIADLNHRGIAFEKSFGLEQDGESVMAGFFRTPHGVRIELWNGNQHMQSDDAIIGEGVSDDSYDFDEEDEDDEDLVDLADLDEDEADRMINKLLGLAPDTQDQIDDTEAEEGDDFDPLLAHEVEGEVFPDDTEEDFPKETTRGASQAMGTPGADTNRTTSRQSPDKLVENNQDMAQRPTPNYSQRNLHWPIRNDRRNGELTYDEIEDDQPYDMD